MTAKISIQIKNIFHEIHVISLIHIELDIRMVGSSKNIFFKYENNIRDFNSLILLMCTPWGTSSHYCVHNQGLQLTNVINVYTIRDFKLLMLLMREEYNGERIMERILVIWSHGISDFKSLIYVRFLHRRSHQSTSRICLVVKLGYTTVYV